MQVEARELEGMGGPVETRLGRQNWQPIPAGCPVEIRAKIVAVRAKRLGVEVKPEVTAETENFSAKLSALKFL
jgi:hypothetical protein